MPGPRRSQRHSRLDGESGRATPSKRGVTRTRARGFQYRRSSGLFNTPENSNPRNFEIRLSNLPPLKNVIHACFPNIRRWKTNADWACFFKLLWNSQPFCCFSFGVSNANGAYSDSISLSEFLWSSNVKKKKINIFLWNWRCAFCETYFVSWVDISFMFSKVNLQGSLRPEVEKAMWPWVHADGQYFALLDWSTYKSQIHPLHCSSLLPSGSNQPAEPFIS